MSEEAVLLAPWSVVISHVRSRIAGEIVTLKNLENYEEFVIKFSKIRR